MAISTEIWGSLYTNEILPQYKSTLKCINTKLYFQTKWSKVHFEKSRQIAKLCLHFIATLYKLTNFSLKQTNVRDCAL